MAGMKPSNPKLQKSSIDGVVKNTKVPPSLVSQTQQIGYVPTGAEPKMRWDQESGIGYIDVGGGSAVPGGYSIELNPYGENKVHWHCQ